VIHDNDNLDAALTAKIKKVFNYGKLDLTDDNNFSIILSIFKKERDQDNEQKAH